MDKEEALRIWVNSLPGSTPMITNIRDLCDGVKLGEALAIMIPDYLNPQLIKKEFGDNALIRGQNIKRILSVTQSYLTHSGLLFDVQHKVDPSCVAQTGDKEQIGRMIEGLVAVALKSDPATYIAPIEYYEKPYSIELMMVIEKILASEGTTTNIAPTDKMEDSVDVETSTLISELRGSIQKLESEKEKYSLDLLTYASKVDQHKIERKEWKEERQKLSSCIQQMEMEAARAEKRNSELLKEADVLSQALENTESDYKSLVIELQEKLGQREEVIGRQKRKVAEMETENQTVHELRERIEILLEKQVEAEGDKVKLTRLREKIAQWKKTKDQLSSLELLHDATLKENSELTFRVQQQSQTIKTLSSYKVQFADVSSSLVQLEVELSVKQSRIQELEDQVASYRSKHEMLRSSNVALENQTKELSNRLQEYTDAPKIESEELFDYFQEAELLTPEIKAKIRHLEIENETLLKTLRENEVSAASAGELDNAKAAQEVLQQSVDTLKHDLAAAKSKSIELQAQLEQKSPKEDISSYIKEISTLQTQVGTLKTELEEEMLLRMNATAQAERAEEKNKKMEEKFAFQLETKAGASLAAEDQEKEFLREKKSLTHQIESLQEQMEEFNAERTFAKENRNLVEHEISQMQMKLEETMMRLSIEKETKFVLQKELETQSLLRQKSSEELAKYLQENESGDANVNMQQEIAAITEQFAAKEQEVIQLQKELQEQMMLRMNDSEQTEQYLVQYQELQARFLALEKESVEKKVETPRTLLPLPTPLVNNVNEEEWQQVQGKLKILEIENVELEKAIDSQSEEYEKKIGNLQTRVDLLHSSLAALGLRYGSKLSISSANSLQRLTRLGNKRAEHGIL